MMIFLIQGCVFKTYGWWMIRNIHVEQKKWIERVFRRLQFASRRLYYYILLIEMYSMCCCHHLELYVYAYNDKLQANGLEDNSEKRNEKKRQHRKMMNFLMCMVCKRGRFPHFVICLFEKHTHTHTQATTHSYSHPYSCSYIIPF